MKKISLTPKTGHTKVYNDASHEYKVKIKKL